MCTDLFAKLLRQHKHYTQTIQSHIYMYECAHRCVTAHVCMDVSATLCVLVLHTKILEIAHITCPPHAPTVCGLSNKSLDHNVPQLSEGEYNIIMSPPHLHCGQLKGILD